jgi:zinc transporter 2
MSLLCISVGLAYEAVIRIYTITVSPHNVSTDIENSSAPHQVNGRLMSIIAFVGVLVNLTLAYVLGEHHVHLPSDDDCHHGHDHDHDHHHNHHNDHHRSTDQPTTDTAAAATSTNSCSGDHHNHSHDHHTSNESDDDHHGHTHEHEHTESTPLLLSTTNSSHGTSNNNSDDTATKPKQWKMPFSPQNINLQAAYLHVLGDLAQSATVLIAGCIIWVVPSLTIIDPICTLLFCILVFYSAYSVCRTSVAVLLQQVPSHLNYHSIRDKIAAVDNVEDVHDLHIWSISHRVPALTVHVSITYPSTDMLANQAKPIHDEVLENIYKIVRCEFDIIHATIQIQSTNGDCVTCVDRLCRPCLSEGKDMLYHDVPHVDADGSHNTMV